MSSSDDGDDGEATGFEASYPREERADRDVNDQPSSLFLQYNALAVGDLPAAIRFLADHLEDCAEIENNRCENVDDPRDLAYYEGLIEGYAKSAGMVRMVDAHIQGEPAMEAYRNVDVDYERFADSVG